MSLFHHAEPAPGEPIQPCPQMRTLLSGYADGSLRGLLRRYTAAHLARCAHCRTALEALQGVLTRLQRLAGPGSEEHAPTPNTSGLSADRWAAVEAAAIAVDATEGDGPPPG